MSVALDGECGVLKKREVPHEGRVRKVNQDADALAAFWGKYGPEQGGEAERGKGSIAVTIPKKWCGGHGK